MSLTTTDSRADRVQPPCQNGNVNLDTESASCSNHHKIGPRDPVELMEIYRANPQDITARNALIEHYLPLVKHNAQRIWSRLPEGVELDDLVAAGSFGLMDAIKAFDPSRGVKFETYCVPRIRGAVLDELREMDWVPRLVRSQASRIASASKELERQLGRLPEVSELAAKMGMEVSQFERFAEQANAVGVISLNKKWYETDSFKDVREIDILVDQKAERPERRLEQRDEMALILRGLNQTERLILICYCYEGMTMKEIGQLLDLSESRVSQMTSQVIEFLRDKFQSQAGHKNGSGLLWDEFGIKNHIGERSTELTEDLKRMFEVNETSLFGLEFSEGRGSDLSGEVHANGYTANIVGIAVNGEQILSGEPTQNLTSAIASESVQSDNGKPTLAGTSFKFNFF